MNTDIESLTLDVELSKKQANFYKKLNSVMLMAESVNKSRRYGREYYVKNFLKSTDGIITSYMNTFLYLRNAELASYEIKDMCSKTLKKLRNEKEILNGRI